MYLYSILILLFVSIRIENNFIVEIIFQVYISNLAIAQRRFGKGEILVQPNVDNG